MEVVVEHVVLRGVGHTGVMVEVQGHVVCGLVSSSLDADVSALVEVEFAEQYFLPVDIRIYVRIESASGVLYVLCGIGRDSRPTCHGCLVVKFHPPASVDEIDHLDWLLEGCLYRCCHLGAHVLGSVLGGDEHHSVGSAHTVDGCGRCVFQQGNVLDGLSREAVEVPDRDLNVIQKDEGSGTASESADATDVEF